MGESKNSYVTSPNLIVQTQPGGGERSQRISPPSVSDEIILLEYASLWLLSRHILSRARRHRAQEKSSVHRYNYLPEEKRPHKASITEIAAHRDTRQNPEKCDKGLQTFVVFNAAVDENEKATNQIRPHFWGGGGGRNPKSRKRLRFF